MIKLINKKIKNNVPDWEVTPLSLILLTALGLVTTYYNPFALYMWISLFVISIYFLFAGDVYKIWYCIALSPGMEIVGRLSTNSKVPKEIGKYYLFFCIILFFVSLIDKRNKYAKQKYFIGIIMLIFLIPSLLFALIYNEFDLQEWVFNVFGILELSILLIFAGKERWSEHEFFNLVKFSVLPIIPVLVYITLKTPKFEDINFTGQSSGVTTAGFGANQVSTCLGAAMFTIATLLIFKKNTFKYFVINILLIIYLLFRGLITFSRGGILVSVTAIVISILVFSFKDIKTFGKNIAIFTIFIFAGFIAFKAVNRFTNNLLYLRYTGKKEGAQKYEYTNELNKITSNRSDIATTDLYIFVDNLLFGVGPGEARYHRAKYGGFNVIPHTEYTRLLSENGLGGFFVVIILTIFPFYWVRRISSFEVKAMAAGLYILGLGSSFHAATRTNITVVCFLLASMPIVFEKVDKNNIKFNKV